MNQKNGVFAAVYAVMGSFSGPVLDVVTKEQKENIHDILFEEFKAGNIDYSGGVPSDEKLKKYIPGLTNNWMRKDLRLNGGSEYQAKNPGSRQNSGDAMLKNMRLLLGTLVEPQARADVSKAILEREQELQAAKVVTVDVLHIPEHLRYLLK